jgi:lipopolysaccharide transport system ATP-binding protein
MSSDAVIQVDRVSKSYELYDKPHDRLKQALVPRLASLVGRRSPRQYFREFAALSDVSFEVHKGETLGIIGRNGSGKSTLLQIICGTLSSTSGSVTVRGRVAALLELGAGFNPDFTGRENIRMSCALLGLTPEDTDGRMDEIVAFADIGEFVEQPVKTYSSGMFVRLAFAVNIVSGADIIVVDEALAVGDIAFQAKCMTALKRMQRAGATVLFVSHDIDAVKSLCTRAIYLEGGSIRQSGTAAEVASEYIRVMRGEINEQVLADLNREAAHGPPGYEAMEPAKAVGAIPFTESGEFTRRVAAQRYGSGAARITYAELLDEHREAVRVVQFDQAVQIAICFRSDVDAQISPNYYIADSKRTYVLGCGTDLVGRILMARANTNYTVVYSTRLPLREGHYSVNLELTTTLLADQSAEFLDVIDAAIVFTVLRRPSGRLWASMYVPNSLEVNEG